MTEETEEVTAEDAHGLHPRYYEGASDWCDDVLAGGGGATASGDAQADTAASTPGVDARSGGTPHPLDLPPLNLPEGTSDKVREQARQYQLRMALEELGGYEAAAGVTAPAASPVELEVEQRRREDRLREEMLAEALDHPTPPADVTTTPAFRRRMFVARQCDYLGLDSSDYP